MLSPFEYDLFIFSCAKLLRHIHLDGIANERVGCQNSPGVRLEDWSWPWYASGLFGERESLFGLHIVVQSLPSGTGSKLFGESLITVSATGALLATVHQFVL